MQKTNYKSGMVAGVLLPLGLICLFACCSLFLALMGGQAYRQIQGNVDESHGGTVAASYVRTKLGQNNAHGSVSIQEMEGLQVLVITTEIQGKPFDTRIFMTDDGQLIETFGPSASSLDLVSGDLIATLEGCHFAIDEDGLFTAEFVSATGTTTRTAFALAKGGRL